MRRLYTEAMVRTWERLLQLLWPQDQLDPPAITSTQLRACGSGHYLLPYKHPQVRALIKRNKYQADKRAARLLAQYIDHYCSSLVTTFCIIPMPISYPRWRERGYNHIAQIMEQSRYQHCVRSDIVTKYIHTTQQTQVTKSERLQQQANTFTCHKERCDSLPAIVIVLDDVITTGATMGAARAALQPHLPPGTKLVCLAIAH